MRVDTTVVETNVHYPTDSSLLGVVYAKLFSELLRPLLGLIASLASTPSFKSQQLIVQRECDSSQVVTGVISLILYRRGITYFRRDLSVQRFVEALVIERAFHG